MTIYFPDVSNNNGAIDVSAAPALFAKATEGTGFVDGYYAGHRDKAHAMGIPFAGYHYLHHGDIQAQAANAFSVVGPGVPLMMDVEVVEGLPDPQYDDLTAFVQAYRALGGTVTLLYLPEWFWSGHWGSPDLTPLAQGGLALISSNYSGYSDTGAGWQPYGGVTPSIWQYTSTANFGGDANVDMNAYRGTIDELRALIGGRPAGGDTKMYTLVPGPNGTTWLCDGMFVREVSEKDVADLRYIASLGAVQLWNNGQLWNGGLAPAFGVDVATLAGVPVTPPTAVVDVAAIAKAVNDDAAKRMQA
jgi:hypothetical protein